MKAILLIGLVVLTTACSTNPNATILAEMGWNKVIDLYQARQGDCFSDGDWINGAFLPDDCKISANESIRAIQITKAYKHYANTFVGAEDQRVNACQMVELAFKLGNIINEKIDPKQIELFCGESTSPANMRLALEEAVTYER